MPLRVSALLAVALLCLAPVAAQAALAPYVGNFESLTVGDPAALSSDGWLVYGNVFSPDGTVWQYGYGTFPAPNGTNAFCDLDTGQGGDLQGLNQLSVYSDYQNTAAHTALNLVESNVFHEQTVAAENVGDTWTFQFDAKLGNLSGASTALAFIKTLNPSAGWVMTNFITVNTTAIPSTWNTYTISLPIDAGLTGQILQFGFSSTTTNFVPSGVYYDNIVFSKTAGAGVGGPGAAVLALRAPAPNPSRGAARLDYSLPRAGDVDLAVFDVLGRRVATLARGVLPAGPHSVTWDGTSNGVSAAAGIYRAVLKTASGQVSRTLVLAR